MIQSFDKDKYNHKVLNLSTGIEITIKEVVVEIIHDMGLDGKIGIEWDITKPVGSKRKKLSNLNLLKLEPNYKFTSFSDGLKKTISWYTKGI